MTTDFDPDAVRIPNGHFIDGRQITSSGDTLAVRRPSDNAICAELPIVAEADTVNQAVESGMRAFRSTEWATGAPRARARLLRRWADLIENNKVALAQLEAATSTRPLISSPP
jgi:aldehyde dehydrogenase (NAD+)